MPRPDVKLLIASSPPLKPITRPPASFEDWPNTGTASGSTASIPDLRIAATIQVALRPDAAFSQRSPWKVASSPVSRRTTEIPMMPAGSKEVASSPSRETTRCSGVGARVSDESAPAGAGVASSRHSAVAAAVTRLVRCMNSKLTAHRRQASSAVRSRE